MGVTGGWADCTHAFRHTGKLAGPSGTKQAAQSRQRSPSPAAAAAVGPVPQAAWPLVAPLRLAAFPPLPLDRLRRAAALRSPGSHLLRR